MASENVNLGSAALALDRMTEDARQRTRTMKRVRYSVLIGFLVVAIVCALDMEAPPEYIVLFGLGIVALLAKIRGIR